MNKFIVTEKAIRPGGVGKKCFYCQEQIGHLHKYDCVFVKKKVAIKMIVEYVVDVPASWDKGQIEFFRNDGRWCTDNVIDELEKIKESQESKDGCLCSKTNFEYIGDISKPFLDEE